MRWVIALFFAFLILPFVAGVQGGPGNSSDANCPSFPEAKVTVTSVFANPGYDFSTGIPEIQALADNIVHQVRIGWALGFTQTMPLLEMDAPVAAVPAGNGYFCARPRYVNIALGTRSETVTIPREIPAESCGFKEVMQHEGEHLEVNRETARKYAALAEQKFADYLKNSPPVREDGLDQAVAVQDNALRSILDEVAVQMITENAALQRDVDSPGEYGRLLHVCNGELADIVRRVRDERYAQR